MHKNFLLSKEVSGVYEFCWHFFNNQLFHDPLFFHKTCLLPLVLSLIPSSFSSATDLISATLGNLSYFSLSPTSHFFLCSYALLFSGFLQFLLMFPSLLSPSVHWNLFVHYQLWYSGLRPPFHDSRLPFLLPFTQYTS